MEHAVEAFKMAFAVILLILAISLSMFVFTKAKSTADVVLKGSDNLRFYDYEKYNFPEDDTGNRIVGMETVIPTVYKYAKERYKVVFKKGKLDASTKKVYDIKPLSIYRTSTERKSWNKNYINDFDGKTTSNSIENVLDICSFDIIDEIKRNEPWTINSNEIKKNLDAFFSGGIYKIPQILDEEHQLNYKRNPLLLNKNNNKIFLETIQEISVKDEAQDKQIIGNKTTKKRIITYILLE